MKIFIELDMKIFFLLILIFISACATTHWVHPTKNAQDFERDKYDCEKVAEQSAANTGDRGNIFILANEMSRCLRLKHGWEIQK